MRNTAIAVWCIVLVGFLEVDGQSYTARIGREVVDPDTTTASRYYPLHVGDAWEYDLLGSPRIIRRDVTGTIMLGDTLYYQWTTTLYENGKPIGFDFYNIRYDETTSFIMQRFDEASEERIFAFAPCPLNADFDATVDCQPFKHPGFDFWDTSGTYEGELVFDESGPGTGGDTVRTSVKRYDSHDLVSVSQYAAGIGQIHVENEVEVFSIYYSRVDG